MKKLNRTKLIQAIDYLRGNKEELEFLGLDILAEKVANAIDFPITAQTAGTLRRDVGWPALRSAKGVPSDGAQVFARVKRLEDQAVLQAKRTKMILIALGMSTEIEKNED